MKTSLFTNCLVLAAASLLSSAQALALNDTDLKKLVVELDERQRNSGDYKSVVFIEQSEKGKVTQAFEATVFRRDADDKWMLIFTKPKSEAGKGYLRLDKNLFSYEPALGKWERRTDRAGIGGTNSRRQDFDESRLSEEYAAKFVADEKLGKFDVHHIALTAKPEADVASPILHLWVDKESRNILKRQERSLSDKLLRTVYYPAWDKKFSKSKGADVYVPKQIRIVDEVEKGNGTTVVLRDSNLDSLPANIFTKAWLESQSR
ncbi:MAG: outer membrane lipoprotein-sorting protein [Betaproteobacteria bacterium]|nr:outer membrane lipoprotein-sorting protein [Betaproteobacteria bacterium]